MKNKSHFVNPLRVILDRAASVLRGESSDPAFLANRRFTDGQEVLQQLHNQGFGIEHIDRLTLGTSSAGRPACVFWSEKRHPNTNMLMTGTIELDESNMRKRLARIIDAVNFVAAQVPQTNDAYVIEGFNPGKFTVNDDLEQDPLGRAVTSLTSPAGFIVPVFGTPQQLESRFAEKRAAKQASAAANFDDAIYGRS